VWKILFEGIISTLQLFEPVCLVYLLLGVWPLAKLADLFPKDSEMNLRNILNFLSWLTGTAEYKNLQARPVLAKRVIEAFSLMAEGESIKVRAFDIIEEGLTSCDDRIISALEEIELMVLLH
jgi:hypothetical protein